MSVIPDRRRPEERPEPVARRLRSDPGASGPSPGHSARVATLRAPRASHWSSRALDVLVAGVAAVALAPAMALIAVLVRVTSSGPAIYRQTRVGHHGRPFSMLKFRSMYVDSDDRVHRQYVTRMLTGEGPAAPAEGGIYKLAGDIRVTPLGAFLRRTSLDELPQLFNVLRGEMSLVGPRPALPWEAEVFELRHQARFSVTPGITGLWQVSGRNRVSMTKALDLDLEYVRRRSLALDLWILMVTLPAVVRGDGAR